MNGDNKDNKNIKFTAGSEEKKQNVEEKVDEKVKKDELVECKERLLQLAAEFDNYKKRIKNEIDISKQK